MSASRTNSLFLLLTVVVVLAFATPSHAFGAGNIASIAKIEGHNFRHGDIEDTLKEIAFLHGAKWTSKMIRRVYFGNWLRDYSQALDVGTLKSVPKDTIRCLVWILSFMSFGYATGEYEVTEERLGVYRPEEHIDNPKGYADDMNAQVYDPRLRPQVHPHELAIDPITGMKNYIANETGGWATSSGYVKFSLTRCIHYGRMYTSGPPGQRGREEDLCEALRCLGQALHCLEDFSAHSNYIELVLRELGFRNVFPHTGVSTEMEIGVPPGYPGGRRAFPLITGTFGSVDFAHSVLGEAQDKFSQTEVDEMDTVLAEAHEDQKRAERSGQGSILKDLLKQMSSAGVLGGDPAKDIDRLERESDAQEMANLNVGGPTRGNFNPIETIHKIYPILEFRDSIMRAIEEAIEKIPGLTALVEKISDTLSIFILSLLAPYIRPLIARASLELKEGSHAVIDSSAAHQYEPWTDPFCTDPTHSMLSKDHFSNKLNTPAGEVASAVIQFCVPRILHAWEDPNFPLEIVLNDVCRVFHHPALRDPNSDIQAGMFNVVVRWTERLPDRGASLDDVLGAEGVRAGKNHTGGVFSGGCNGGHGKVQGAEWSKKDKRKKDKKDGKSKKDDKYAAIPGISSSGGTINVAGVKLPGVFGGILDAGLAGFQEGGGMPGGYDGGHEKKKDKKDKDKKEKVKYGSGGGEKYDK
ncbi:HET-C domain protein [Sphaerosporella brunnea]|uniref:HET-C domain protein n=1 Tax=Sphaerosporella brunnea TaxID=1250544 RepID=A0A5J5F9T6_9PEZI|nr:HET-C domain protein [Sphaerosporella brunnea]